MLTVLIIFLIKNFQDQRAQKPSERPAQVQTQQDESAITPEAPERKPVPARQQARGLTAEEEARAREQNELTGLAVKSFQEGDYEASRNHFTQLLRFDNRALKGLGLSYFKLGDYESAARFLESAVTEGIDEFQSRKFLAFAYYRMDDLDNSLRHAGAALGIRQDADLAGLVEKLGREQPVQESFIEEQTLHFKVIFDGYEHSGISTMVLNILEEAYDSIGSRINHYPDGAISVVLYGSKDFYDTTRLPSWSGGSFDGKIRVPVRGLGDAEAETLRKVLFHEYTHALVYSISPRCPLWINEGLAMAMSGETRRLVGQALPLDSLQSTFPMSPEGGRRLAYDVSYSAVNYLIENHGLYSLAEYLDALGGGEGLDEAFQSAFYMTYNEFLSDWGK